MKTSILKYTLAAGLACAVFSCTKLDETFYDRGTDDNFLKTEDELNAFANSAYANMRNYRDAYWKMNEVTTDETTVPSRGADWNEGGLWRVLISHQFPVTHQYINDMWNSIYQNGVNPINAILQKLDQSKIQLPTKDQIQAQMKVLRAFHFYLAMDAFGNIPIVTSFSQADPPKNTPRAQAFTFIEKEILDNIQALPAELNTKNYGKVTKGMGFMLLARLYANAEVYTGTARWNDCIRMCDSVTKQGYQLEADYFTNFSTHNETSKENIFVVPYDAINAKGMMLHYLTLHYNNRYTYGLPSSPWNGWCTLKAHYESYDNDDKRKTMFLVGQQYSQDGTPLKTEQGDPLIFTPEINDLANATQVEGVRIVKYEIQKNTPYADQDNDLVIFRYADALMLKAECLLRTGQQGPALTLVNEVRARNFATAKPLVTLTLDNLLAERGREFIWEGCRRQDLIRFGKWNSAWQFHAPDQDFRKLFPIPQAQLDANPNLEQNMGYK
ncbi:RagB/SusD family nutrient uptake outer membrane protein [Chitinophaga qingshengii]|uniref:RagB/SusD family nutrient uptake outer membrane protein n=1 Tax=Chitinophaga qingshengii TaxID=1569794 RepID=A0ABR7TX32_9BACT|nr:RagB/SusD family nutrient uptake outer membrane protein [Chitinophaga qingshengii]MBC9935041.1 RagB/SusD family nutrient uptake outer membrane protein [Chitinophaga qingshengii]